MREGLGVVVGLALVGVVLWHRSAKTLAADAQELHAFPNPEALLRILDEATPELLLEQRGALGERVAQQWNDKLERNLRGREILQGQEAGGLAHQRQKKSEGTFKDGEPEGPFIGYFPDGTKKGEESWSDDKLEGLTVELNGCVRLVDSLSGGGGA